jgi:hypothetical protein
MAEEARAILASFVKPMTVEDAAVREEALRESENYMRWAHQVLTCSCAAMHERVDAFLAQARVIYKYLDQVEQRITGTGTLVTLKKVRTRRSAHVWPTRVAGLRRTLRTALRSFRRRTD